MVATSLTAHSMSYSILATHRKSFFIFAILATLTACAGSSAQVATPTLHPIDATLLTGKIAYVAAHGDQRKIHLMNADGSNAHQLTDNAPRDDNPQWSPDGKHIVFESYVKGRASIFVVDADGSYLRALAGNGNNDFFPYWSPDRTMIVFTSNYERQTGIFTMNADGSNVTRLTKDVVEHEGGGFSPDGAQLLFTSER